MGKPVLAQYTIRSKQDYIFKTNRIVEIMGASANIGNAWNVLFEEAEKCGKRTARAGRDTAFCLADTQRQFGEKTLQMAELFCGGGNELVMYDSADTCREVNQAFSYRIMKDYAGMIPMCEYQEVSGDYRRDYDALMQKADRLKNTMIPGRDEFILPFSMMDRDTFEPHIGVIKIEGSERPVTAESLSKRVKGMEIRSKDNAVKLLDSMVTKKGEEGLLAVVHADGNNMGSKIMGMLRDQTDYDFCVQKMREFTRETNQAFVETGKQALRDCCERLKKQYAGKKLKDTAFAFREVIADGDDMTFICNARFVMEYVKAYLNAVDRYASEWKYSACAGICIFHSHYPFARAYSLAEQCCDDGAKAIVHKTDEKHQPVAIEEGWADYHFIHSGIGGDLTEIRRTQGTGVRMARPWRICGRESISRDYARLEKLAQLLQANKVARSNVKAIGSAWEYSNEEGYREFERAFRNERALQTEMKALFAGDSELLLKALYDLSEIYDLWFREVG